MTRYGELPHKPRSVPTGRDAEARAVGEPLVGLDLLIERAHAALRHARDYGPSPAALTSANLAGAAGNYREALDRLDELTAWVRPALELAASRAEALAATLADEERQAAEQAAADRQAAWIDEQARDEVERAERERHEQAVAKARARLIGAGRG